MTNQLNPMRPPMSRHCSFVPLLLLSILPTTAQNQPTAPAASAQTTAPSPTSERRPTRGFGFGSPTVESPDVSADKRATFRLRAPNATNVVVRGIMREPLPMLKDSEGLWTATAEALQPDLYAYSFVVDGLSMVDPSNTRFRPSYHRVGQSSVLVPATCRGHLCPTRRAVR